MIITSPIRLPDRSIPGFLDERRKSGDVISPVLGKFGRVTGCIQFRSKQQRQWWLRSGRPDPLNVKGMQAYTWDTAMPLSWFEVLAQGTGGRSRLTGIPTADRGQRRAFRMQRKTA